MKYYVHNREALEDLIGDLQNDNGLLKTAKEDVESELDYAYRGHRTEDDLGCHPEVMLKALLQGYIYTDCGEDMGFLKCNVTDLEKWNVTDLEYFESFEKFALVNINGVNVGLENGVNGTYAHLRKDAFLLEDYGKTWWLKKDKSE